MKHLLPFLFILFLTGCISSGRYSHRNDSAPNKIPEQVNQEAVEPYFVEHAKANSRPYTVFGKQYFPMQSAKGYEASGEASWYGQKFHGHLTANGEIYNMYDMTAAHKTLPLPSFVRVTNIESGRQTIVRVNDRGPFHDDRLIDLSWAAAKKLDVLKNGTAKVKIEVIHVDKDGLVTIGKGLNEPENEPENAPALMANNAKDKKQEQPEEQNATFIQVATSSDSQKINELAKGLSYLFHMPTETPKSEKGYHLRLGPLAEGADVQNIIEELRNKGFMNAFKVNVPL